MLNLYKQIWRGWKGFAHRIIAAQNWFLMAMVYVTAVAPVAVMMKLFRRPLLDRSLGDEGAESYWIPREDGPYTMEKSKHMS